MLSPSHLQKDFDNLAREDAFFDDYFKHVSGKPVQYLDQLEDLLFENPYQLITICQGIPDNVSYFVNRICCYFINNLGIDRQFKNQVFTYLGRLINILEKASVRPEVSVVLEPFFEKRVRIDNEPEVPSAFDRLQKTYIKYSNLKEGAESTWQRKQQLGKRIVRYPHLYSNYFEGGISNPSFKQTNRVRQNEYIKNYSINLHRYLRQETSKDMGLLNGLASSQHQPAVWENPTQLNKHDLYQSVFYYKQTEEVFKKVAVDANNRYSSSSLAECKLLFHQAIVNIFPSEYRKAFLNHKLFISLQNQELSFDDKIVTQALIKILIDYCFKLLVIDENKNHFFFIDMISNIGTKRTLSILLQLVHCYPVDSKVRDSHEQKQLLLSALEKRLAMLFKNYEDFEESEMKWLIYFLEHFNLATALQFDGLDVSGIQIPKVGLNHLSK
jgi:hypothetical protein